MPFFTWKKSIDAGQKAGKAAFCVQRGLLLFIVEKLIKIIYLAIKTETIHGKIR